MPLKILTVNTDDIKGGAAIAAYRLHTGLLKLGLDSKMMVYNKHSRDPNVLFGETCLADIRILKRRINTLRLLPYTNKTKAIFSAAISPSFLINKKINELNPDIVHLHWINAEFIRIENLVKIKTPIIWSLHDMWPFTGGCHYNNGCSHYLNHCHSCPTLGSSKQKDLSYSVFERKFNALKKIENITFIGLSSWIANSARESALLKNHRIEQLPNCIDTDFFYPIDKNASKEALGMPNDKKLVVFGASSATSDPRKGFQLLLDSIKEIQHPNDVEILIFGGDNRESKKIDGVTVRFIGLLNDAISLRLVYNAADILIAPSLEENLSNTIMESMSCATPVVAFNIGGNSDLITHKIDGYLAEEICPSSLAAGINWALYNTDSLALSASARKKVLSKFEISLVSKQYKNLYKNILG